MGNKGRFWMEFKLPLSDDNPYDRATVGAEVEVEIDRDTINDQLEEFAEVGKIVYEDLEGNIVDRFMVMSILKEKETLKATVKAQALELKKVNARLDSTITQVKKMMKGEEDAEKETGERIFSGSDS